MLAPRRSAGALTREAAMALVEDISRLDQLTARYREAIAELPASA
jgi:hypothetical protein